jgi:hypothetical protein
MSTHLAKLRRLLLALVVLGALGLIAELLLLEHYEDSWQWAPLVLLTATLASAVAVGLRPVAASLAIFRVVMLLCVAAGGVGVFLHYRGNAEFELERTPSLRGVPLLWESLRGATPALAPGAMAQLGLLGLLFAWRHPAGRREHTITLDHLEES